MPAVYRRATARASPRASVPYTLRAVVPASLQKKAADDALVASSATSIARRLDRRPSRARLGKLPFPSGQSLSLY